MTLTPDEIDQERQRFEAWQDAFIIERDVPPSGFRAWLAAIESERERARKASGELTLDEALNICGIERETA